jgi:hypothetical protein
MLTLSQEEWSQRQIAILETVLNQRWFDAKRVDVAFAPDITSDVRNPVLKGLEYTLRSIGLDFQLVFDFDQGLNSINQNGPLDIDKFDVECLERNYDGALVVVTANDGVIYDKLGTNPARAASNYKKGHIYLPIPDSRKSESDYSLTLTSHEAGHVFFIQPDHHDLINYPGTVILQDGANVFEEMDVQSQPYVVEGYMNVENCVMNTNLRFHEGYKVQRSFCDRSIESAKIKWSHLERELKTKFLRS